MGDQTKVSIPGVTITKGPRHWQVLQRNERGVVDIEVEGTWFAEETEISVQVRIVDENTHRPVSLDLDWRDATLDALENRFSIVLCGVPQGGLYRVETRVRRPLSRSRWALRGDCIHHIGVGDLYVIAGQSNASGTGKGSVHDGPALGVHLFGNDERWRLATHPLEDATDTLHPVTITGIFHGHSPWLAFGKRIYARTGIPVGLIPTALGGSPIKRWIRDDGEPGDLFDNMADMIRKAGGSIAAMLWYQGESDANPEGIKTYKSRFQQLTERLRELVGNGALPVFTGQLNRHLHQDLPHQASWCAIRELQRCMAHSLHNVRLVVTIDCPLSDDVHNHAVSNVIIGERFADLALEMMYGALTDSAFPEPEQIRFGNDGCIEIEFAHLSGDWVQTARIRDFTVEDEAGFVPIGHIDVDEHNRIHIRLERKPSGGVMLHGLYGYAPTITLRDDGGRCMTPFSLPVQMSTHD